jgi:hypothetical protein
MRAAIPSLPNTPSVKKSTGTNLLLPLSLRLNVNRNRQEGLIRESNIIITKKINVK